MSGDPEQQYFSDGITEDIITELSRFRSLFVVARNSSFQYRDKAVDVRRVARELGVRYVVEGSVRKMAAGSASPRSSSMPCPGNHLWSERYDRNIDELFEVQDEVTQNDRRDHDGPAGGCRNQDCLDKRTDSLPHMTICCAASAFARLRHGRQSTRARVI